MLHSNSSNRHFAPVFIGLHSKLGSKCSAGVAFNTQFLLADFHFFCTIMHLMKKAIAMLREFTCYGEVLEKCFPVAIDYAKAPEPSWRIDHLRSGQSRETDDRFDRSADGGVQHVEDCHWDFSQWSSL